MLKIILFITLIIAILIVIYFITIFIIAFIQHKRDQRVNDLAIPQTTSPLGEIAISNIEATTAQPSQTTLKEENATIDYGRYEGDSCEDCLCKGCLSGDIGDDQHFSCYNCEVCENGSQKMGTGECEPDYGDNELEPL